MSDLPSESLSGLNRNGCPITPGIRSGDARLREEAKRLADCILTRLDGHALLGFATFVPELQSRVPEIQAQAHRFFRVLLHCAAIVIDARRAAGPSFTIELVCGSHFGGVWPAKVLETMPNPYAVNRHEVDSTIDRFVGLLDPLAREACDLGPLRLAAELEPGALFSLSNAAAL